MKILGIDTSTPIGSVALVEDDTLVAEWTLNIFQEHSSRLMLAIDSVLKGGNITIADVDACAVGVGPGSFTGIRIGVATVKSICYALDKPIVGVSTLAAIAYNLRWTDGVVCPLLDARRGEIYGAAFRGGTAWERLTEDLCLPIEAFLDRILADTGRDEPLHFVGDGLLTYGDAVRAKLGDGVRFAEPVFNVPRGAAIACLGKERLDQGNVDDYWNLVPNYVRVGLY